MTGPMSARAKHRTSLPTFDDVSRRAKRIERLTRRHADAGIPILNERAGARVLLKAETLQRTGSFKFRGAHNLISQIAPGDWPGGVVACSSGNHAQGVAEAARLAGLRATIVMPRDAPEMKIARTRRAGAEVVLYDRDTKTARRSPASCAASAKRCSCRLTTTRHHRGQGTAGLELFGHA